MICLTFEAKYMGITWGLGVENLLGFYQGLDLGMDLKTMATWTYSEFSFETLNSDLFRSSFGRQLESPLVASKASSSTDSHSWCLKSIYPDEMWKRVSLSK